jgi:APA family basic amino acid/polyamine antiporter
MDTLKRKLGLADGLFLVVGAVFGSGIFLTTGLIAESLPSHGLIWMIWLIGGIMTVMGANVYAELGTMFPVAGGPYVYLREAYGRGAAFLYGWMFFWIIGGGGIAAIAMGFAEYFGMVVPGAAAERVFSLGNGMVKMTIGPMIAVAAIALLSGLNYFGVEGGARFQDGMTVIRLAFLLGFIVLGLFAEGSSSASPLRGLFPRGPWPAWTAFGTAFLAVIWAYDGWYAVNCTAEEMRNPSRTISRSLLLGTLTITVLYVATNIVYSKALSVNSMKGVVRIGWLAAAEMFGTRAGRVFTAGVAATIFGCLSANILASPRVAFGLARDGLFFRRLAEIHPTYGVPSKAVLAQGLWAGFLCFTGTYRELIEFVSLALIVFFVATAGALFVLRLKAAGRERPYRAWGYPWTTAFYILVNLAALAAVLLSHPKSSFFSLGIIAAGVPAYIIWSTRRPAEGPRGEQP